MAAPGDTSAQQDDPYGPAIAEILEKRRAVGSISARSGVKIAPEKALEAIDLSRKTGHTPDLILRDPSIAEAQKLAELPMGELRGSPELARRLGDPVKAAPILGAAPEYVALTRALAEPPTMGAELKHRWATGWRNVEAGSLGIAAVREMYGGAPMSPSERARWAALHEAGPPDPDIARELGQVRGLGAEFKDALRFMRPIGADPGPAQPGISRSIPRRSLGETAEQLPNLYESSKGALAGFGIGVIPGAAVVLAGGATLNPALVAAGAWMVGAGGTAGALLGAGESSFEIELGGSLLEYESFRTPEGEPLDRDLVVGSAIVSAGIKSGLEMVSFRALAKLVPGLSAVFALGSPARVTAALAARPELASIVAQIGADFGKATLTESGTEWLQEVTDIVIGRRAQAIASGQDFDYIDELGGAMTSERAMHAAEAAFLATLTIGGASGGTQIASRYAKESRQASKHAQRVKSVQRAVAALQGHADAAPEDFDALATNLGLENGLGEVSIPADKLAELFQSKSDATVAAETARDTEVASGDAAAPAATVLSPEDEAAAKSPTANLTPEERFQALPAEIQAEIMEKAVTGEDIVLPLGVYLRHVARDYGKRAVDHLRLAPGLPTVFESQALAERVQTQADEIEAESLERNALAEFPGEVEMLAQRVKERVMASGAIKDEVEAAGVAAQVAAIVSTSAKRRGVTLEQVIKRVGELEFLGPELAAAARSEGGFKFGTTQDVLEPAERRATPRGAAAEVWDEETRAARRAKDTPFTTPATTTTELQQAEGWRTGAETLEIRSKKKRPDRRELGRAIQAYVRKVYGKIDRESTSPRSRDRIAAEIAREVLAEIAVSGLSNSGVGWYTRRFQAALDLLSHYYPEIADPGKRTVLIALLAITSEGVDPVDNMTHALTTFDHWSRTGEMKTFGHPSNTVAGRAERLATAIRKVGLANLEAYLLEEKSLETWYAEARLRGEKPQKAEYLVETIVPRSVVLFGAKLGAFYANLSGRPGYLTMDMWWSRTFNRIRGTLLTKPTEKSIETFKERLAKEPGWSARKVKELSDPELMVEVARYAKAGEASYKATKTKTEIQTGAQGIIAKAKGLVEQPANGTERKFMIDTAQAAQKLLAAEGVDLTISDIQAVLWLFEKRLYDKLTGEVNTAGEAYDTAALHLADKDSFPGRGRGGVLRSPRRGADAAPRGDAGPAAGDVVAETGPEYDELGDAEGVTTDAVAEGGVVEENAVEIAVAAAIPRSAADVKSPGRWLLYWNPESSADYPQFQLQHTGGEAKPSWVTYNRPIDAREPIGVTRRSGERWSIPFEALSASLSARTGLNLAFISRHPDGWYAGALQALAQSTEPDLAAAAKTLNQMLARAGFDAVTNARGGSVTLLNPALQISEPSEEAIAAHSKISDELARGLFKPPPVEALVAAGEPIRIQETKTMKVGTLTSGLTKVYSPEEVAHLVAQLRKSPQEQQLVVVTGKRGKLLAVFRSSLGTSNQTFAEPVSMLGPAMAVPGAARIWTVHNHPAGDPSPSGADFQVHRRDREILRGSGIEYMGALVVAPQSEYVGGTKQAPTLDEGTIRGPSQVRASYIHPSHEPGDFRAFEIPAHARTSTIELLGRRFKRMRPTGSFPAVTTPSNAVEVSKKLGGGSFGILFADIRMRPVGFVPMNPDEMRRLRSGDIATGVGKLLREAATTNAANMVAYVPDVLDRTVTHNLARFSIMSQITLTDAVDDAGHSFAAESGGDLRNEIGRTPQEFRQGERGSIIFQEGAERRAAILFTQSRDPSTGIHELGHWFLRLRLSLGLELDATPQERADALEMLRQIKARDALALAEQGASGDAVIRALTRDNEELFANLYLAYAREGKAPSNELRAVFAQMRSWLVAIYRSVKRLLGTERLTDEMRAVFDRMLATDEAVAEALKTNDLVAKIKSAADLGVSPAEFEKLEALRASVIDKAKQKIDQKQLKKIERLRGVFDKVERERERMAAEQLDTIRAEVEAELSAVPAWKAEHYLRTGNLLGEPTPEGLPKVKLSRRAVERMAGENTVQRMVVDRWVAGRNSLVTEDDTKPVLAGGGIHPDEISQQFGFATGLDLVRALMEIGAGDPEAFERAVEQETTRRYREAERPAPGEIEEQAVRELSTSETKIDFLIAELRALERKAKQPDTPRMALETAARQIIAGRQVKDLRPDRHRGDAKRARYAAMDAVRRGDFAAAANETRKEVLATILARYSEAAREEADEFHAFARELDNNRKLRERIGRAGHEYLERIDEILARFELSASMRAVALAELATTWAQGERDAGRSVFLTREIEDRGVRQHWRTLTMEQVRGIADSLKSMKTQALDVLEVKIGNEMIERERVIESMKIDLARGVLRPATRSRQPGGGTRTDVALGLARSADASLTQVEPFLNAIVNGDHKSFWMRAIIDPLMAAQGRYDDLRVAYAKKVEEAYRRFDKKTQQAYREVLPESRLWNPHLMVPGPMELTKWHLIAIALNRGNQSNFDKLCGGYGWNQQTVKDVLNQHLTDEDWAFVQELWDITDSLWPEFAKLEKEVVGIEPERIERVTFSTASGKILAGGYWPVLYDSKLSRTGASNEAHAALDLSTPAVGSPTTRAGSAITRTKVELPILLDIGSVMSRHLDEVIRDLCFRKPLLDASKILGHPSMDRALRVHLGAEFDYQNFWLPWLRSVRADFMSAPTVDIYEKLFRSLRAHASVFKLGFRLSTILAQPSGVINAIQTIYQNTPEGFNRRDVVPILVSAYAESLGYGDLEKAAKARSDVLRKSALMRHRVNQVDADARYVIHAAQRGERKDLALAAFSMKCIGLTQMHSVDVPVWLASYKIARGVMGMTEEESIVWADRQVRLSQGAGYKLSQPAFLSSSSHVLRGFGVFYSFQNTVLNQVRQTWRRDHDVPSLLASYWFSLSIPTIWTTAMGAIVLAVEGREPDDDWWKRRAIEFFGGNLLGTIPFIRDVYPILFGEQPRTGSVIEPWYQTLDRAAKADEPKEVMIAWARMIGLIAGQPVDWALTLTQKWMTEEDQR